MRKTIALAVASAFALVPIAYAQYPDTPYYQSNSYYQSETPRLRDAGDTARVIESTPVYAAATREECWNPSTGTYEARRDEHTGIGKGAALGALAGGVLGHQIDHGTGTAAGAILGGVIGHQLEKRDRQDDLDLSRCRYASEDSSTIEGYEVRYRYAGNEYVTRMAQDPGRRLRVGEDINWDGTPFDQVAYNSDPMYSYR